MFQSACKKKKKSWRKGNVKLFNKLVRSITMETLIVPAPPSSEQRQPCPTVPPPALGCVAALRWSGVCCCGGPSRGVCFRCSSRVALSFSRVPRPVCETLSASWIVSEIHPQIEKLHHFANRLWHFN